MGQNYFTDPKLSVETQNQFKTYVLPKFPPRYFAIYKWSNEEEVDVQSEERQDLCKNSFLAVKNERHFSFDRSLSSSQNVCFLPKVNPSLLLLCLYTNFLLKSHFWLFFRMPKWVKSVLASCL